MSALFARPDEIPPTHAVGWRGFSQNREWRPPYSMNPQQEQKQTGRAGVDSAATRWNSPLQCSPTSSYVEALTHDPRVNSLDQQSS